MRWACHADSSRNTRSEGGRTRSGTGPEANSLSQVAEFLLLVGREEVLHADEHREVGALDFVFVVHHVGGLLGGGLSELVDTLRKKKDRVVIRREKEPEPVDLVEVLKRSLKRGEASRRERAVTRRQTRPKRRASRS